MRSFFAAKKRLLCTLLSGMVCFAVCVLVWLVAVRGLGDKSLSARINDDYTTNTAVLEPGDSVSQEFSFGESILAMAFRFTIPDKQPAGALQLTLTNIDTGEVVARSTGDMANIAAEQYIGMGLDTPVLYPSAEHRYVVTLTPEYAGDGRLALGCSEGAPAGLSSSTVNGETQPGTLALIISFNRVGGFLTKFYLILSALCCLLVMGAVWFAMGEKIVLHRLAFALILCFGMLYSIVLPPYSAPDEQYHINQSFTLASQWANRFSPEEWRMGAVPMDISFRRETDVNSYVQDPQTTVFTWKQIAHVITTPAGVPFHNHKLYEEAQVDNNPTLYLPSAAAVFLCYLLQAGFVLTLYAGRTANLLLYALLAALAVKRAPFGKRVFFAVSLLPMSLHLAASFSRDSLLLGLCFAFTALVLEFAYAPQPKPLRSLLLPALFGLLLTPAKLAYLPLAALCLLLPAERLGRYPHAKRLGYLALCLLVTLAVNRTVVRTAAGASQEALPESVSTAAETATETAAEPNTEAVFPSEPEAAEPVEAAPSDEFPEFSSTALLADWPVPDEELLEQMSRLDAEGLVLRFAYYGERRTDLSQQEVDFWALALENRYVEAVQLGQSFFFGPETQSFTPEQFVLACSAALCGEQNVDALPQGLLSEAVSACQNGNWSHAYKILYSLPQVQELADQIGCERGCEDVERFPLDRRDLYAETQERREIAERRSVATAEDAICFTPGYILHHLPQTLLLLVNSVLEHGDHYLRGLVGGSLSYYSLELAWGWVLLLYLLLLFAAVPVGTESALPLTGTARLCAVLPALACCGLVVAGCLTWTPTYYTALYGLQGRYFLPVLPLALLACTPHRLRLAGIDTPERPLVISTAVLNTGILLNAILAVIAR